MNQIKHLYESSAVRALRLRADNPFLAQEWNTNWPNKASIADLRNELMRRGLPQHGSSQELQGRMDADDELFLSMVGKYEIHKRRIAAMEAQKKDIMPFPRFLDFPPELRLIIWKFCLPGPRVLNTSDCRDTGDILHFLKHDNEPNPVILSVCQESREFALRTYRLCFGTPNVYMDLTQDILYFGSHWRNTLISPMYKISWERWIGEAFGGVIEPAHLSDAVIADLRSVKRIAIRYGIWATVVGRSSTTAYAGGALHHHFSGYDGLEELLLVEHKGKEEADNLYALTPGHIVFERRQHPRHSTVRSLRDVIAAECSKKSSNKLSKVTVVRQHRVTVVPDDDWQRDHGKIYHIPKELQTPYQPTSPPRTPSFVRKVKKLCIRARRPHFKDVFMFKNTFMNLIKASIDY